MDSKHTGSFGDYAVFSFNGNKIITSGGGGAIASRHKDNFERAKFVSRTAKEPHAWDFYHSEVGFNYRMPALNASFLSSQLKHLDKILENKRKTAAAYREFFSNIEGAQFVDEPPGAKSNFWLNSVIMNSEKDRDSLLQECHEHKVGARPLWKCIHTLPMYKGYCAENLENAMDLQARVVSLPSSYREGQ